MRTSKRLLSFFLALVMVITGCSLGFTAYAADGNKTDSNLNYWNDASSADEAFGALNNLIDGLLQIDAVKNLLQSLGIDADSVNTVSDLVQVASPTMIDLLVNTLGTADLSMVESFLSGVEMPEFKRSKETFLASKYSDYASKKTYYDNWYAALDKDFGGEEDLIDFYALYGICDLHQNDGGELGDYCKDTLKKLDALFDSIPQPVATEVEQTELQKSKEYLDAIIAAAIPDASLYATLLTDFEEATYEDKALKDYSADELKDTDAAACLEYYNNLLSKMGKSEISNLAELLYYYGGKYERYNLIYELYFQLAEELGVTIDTTNLGVDTGTAKEVAEAYSQTTDFDTEAGMYGGVPSLNLWNWDEHDYAAFDEFFEAFTFGKLFLDEDGLRGTPKYFGSGSYDDYGDILGEYYQTLTKALAKDSGVDVDGLELTDAQVQAMVSAAQANGWSSASDLSAYLDSSDISDAAKNYIKAVIAKDSSAVDGFAAALANGDTSYALTDDEQQYFEMGLINSFIDRVNAMVYSQALVTNIEEKDGSQYDRTADLVNDNITSEINVLDYYLEFVANTPAQSEGSEDDDVYEGPTYHYGTKEDYADVKTTNNIKDTEKTDEDEETESAPVYVTDDDLYVTIPDSLSVEMVNAILNNIVELLKEDTVQSLLAGVFESDVDFYAIFHDFWKNLYNEPAATVFKLIPLIAIAMDELVLPFVLHEKEEPSMVSGMIIGFIVEFIMDYTQMVGDTDIGLGTDLYLDLNVAVPAILHWVTGDTSLGDALEHYGDVEGLDPTDHETKVIHHYDSSVPKFTDIYGLDKYVAMVHSGDDLVALISNLLSGYPKSDEDYENEGITDNDIESHLAAFADAIAKNQVYFGELAQEFLVFTRDAVDEYLAEHGEDTRYKLDENNQITISQKGLNNLSVAVPYLIDTVGQKFKQKYEMNASDWTFVYDGRIEMRTITLGSGDKQQEVSQLVNVELDELKQLANGGTAGQILDKVIDILIGGWLNGGNDFLNDLFSDENNAISYNMPLLQGLISATGGFGEQCVLTDILDGFFQLKRSDDESFALIKRNKTNFVGFSNESVFFLLSNLEYSKDGEIRGLIPFVKTLIAAFGEDSDTDNTEQADYKLNNVFVGVSPLLANSKKNTSAAGTNYNELLSKENVAAAQKLVDTLDEILSSLLSNTSLNGYDLDANDNIIAAVASFASAYFGAKNTNDIVKLINDYLYFAVGECKQNKWNVIGNYPTKDGDVDKNKVYTSANLSNLVIQTYSLVENIIDYLFYNTQSGLLKNADPNMLIADALYGAISPDAVAVRLSDDYKATAKILKKKDYLNWNSFKVQITAAYNNGEKYNTKDYLKFGFKKGDKDGFYKALGESLNGVAAVAGVLLTKSYVDEGHTKNYYSELVKPTIETYAKAVGAKANTMSVKAFNNATPGVQIVQGIILPVSNIVSKMYEAPASFALNMIKGIAGFINEDSFTSTVNTLAAPIGVLYKGLLNLIGNSKYLNAPKLAQYIQDKIQEYLDMINAAVDFILGLDVSDKYSVIKATLEEYSEYIDIIMGINWDKLSKAKSPAEVLLLIYGYVVDSLLNLELVQDLIDSLDPSLSKIVKNLSATQILSLINQLISSVTSPTEIYWTFKAYSTKLSNSFTYPKGITASKANQAVDQLDELVKKVFPLLNGFGITDISGLDALVSDSLYKNEVVTTLAKTIYGALADSDAAAILALIGLDVTPAGVAAYLTDKSYGKKYSSAASTLKSAKSWKSVKTVNWGFKDGSKDGFFAGVAAALRPLNDVLAILLVEGGKVDLSTLDLVSLVKTLSLNGSFEIGEDLDEDKQEYACTVEYKIKNGQAVVTFRSHAIQYDGKRTRKSVLEVDLVSIAKDIEKLLAQVNFTFGTNGYESAIIPLLEAFMCDGVKTYKQYKSDYAKAKDNLILDILEPIGNLIDAVCDKPFDTITAILPNVAYFIDNYGLEQMINNLLAPITADDGIYGVLKKNGIDIDKLVYSFTGKTIGEVITDAADLDFDLKLEIGKLSETNLHKLILPFLFDYVEDNFGIKLPKFDWSDIASHGDVKTVASKALNAQGKYSTLQVQARQGEVLVAVLRYLSETIINNTEAIKKIVLNLDDIKKDKTLQGIIQSILDQIAQAKPDDIVNAIFYLLGSDPKDKFFDYRNFQYKDYEFSFGDLDEDFCRQLAPMLDGMIEGLLPGEDGASDGLAGLIETNVYKDEVVANIAKGLYGAVEDIKIDGMGSLTSVLAQTGIDFSTSNAAALLKNDKYGRTYPDAAAAISRAGSWKKVNAANLKFGVTDRDSFLHALTAVLRPLFGVLDVILNDAYLGLFDIIDIPGTDGYTSTIVPLLEAFGVYNVKTQYQYREDIFKEYDSILLDILNPLWDKVEDILNAPIQTLMNILPNLALFFANDGLIQLVENLLTPVSELLEALKPIVDVNDVLKKAGINVPKLLKDKVGISISKFDVYDLAGTLKPVVGADNVINTLNSVLKTVKISGQPLGIELPDVDWFQLASHGEYILNATSQAATYGGRIAVQSDEDETLIAVLRFLVDTINYKDNYDSIVDLVSGIISESDDMDDSMTDVIEQVLGLLQGDTDSVIKDLVDLLQTLGG